MDSLIKNVTNGTLPIQNFNFDLNSFISCTSIFLMAITTLYIGVVRSAMSEKDKKLIERISTKEAAILPFIASIGLFSMYIMFKVCSLMAFDLLADTNECSVQTKDFIGSGLAVILGLCYFFTGHWVTNNFIAISIAILGIEFVQLNKFKNAVLLLCGLFFYDIFWVFGTSVMVTVAKNLNAPIKITFPRDFLVNGLFSKELSLLGLGDIVVPGLLISMLLRFDSSLNRQGKRSYFLCGYFAYCASLLFTFVMMYMFKHAQPALLYLVPACLILPFFMAYINNDLESMLNYTDGNEDESATDDITANAIADEPKKVK